MINFSSNIKQKLSELLKDITDLKDIIDLQENDIIINGITSNSTEVKNGYLFCSLSENANQYIESAISNGASVVISNRDYQNNSVLHIRHDNPKNIYYKICSNFYNKQPANISAVTGTNGKTSICYFFEQICGLARRKSASIGTLGFMINRDVIENNSLTTPDASKLHKFLYDLAYNHVDNVIMEASSHGIDQKRLHAVNINAAVFTNLTQDHLDYHQDLESYFQVKLKLFNEILKDDGHAIINIDDQYFDKLIKLIENKKIITYGYNKSDVQILEQEPTINGQNIKLKVFDNIIEVKLNVFGKFQAYNLAAAVSLAISNDIDVYTINYEHLNGPPGRMEQIKNRRNAKVIVDYAHTPDALQNALLSLKWHFPKYKILLVFGCGGDRDKKKRPIMGEIAFKLADKIIVCDDSPRSEDPAQIRSEILSSCRGKAIEIGDRRKAIEHAILNYSQNILNDKTNDNINYIILITGMGHENLQKFTNYQVEFSDIEVVSQL